MANDTTIGCFNCKEYLGCIGNKDTIFIADAETVQALSRFLTKHRGHYLLYDLDECDIFADEKVISCAVGFDGQIEMFPLKGWQLVTEEDLEMQRGN